MLRRLPSLAGMLTLATLLLCGQASADQGMDYAKAYAAHDFFALRAMVAADKGPDSEQKRFYSAAVLTAFNQPAAANKLIEPMLSKNIDTALMPFLLQMRMQNDLRLYDYSGALDAERTLVDLYERKGDSRLGAAQNHIKLLSALSGTDPQKVTRSGDSHIILAAEDKGAYCAPVTVGIDPCYSFASDVPYSVLSRSEAQRLKLKVLPAGFQLPYGSGSIGADVTVASSLLLGNLQYDDVVFLVVPDNAISSGGVGLPGLLGYPIFAGMGAVTHSSKHVLDIPKSVPAKQVGNIALDGDSILTLVQVRGHQALCRLDFRAPQTIFYKPYYATYMDDLGGSRPKAVPAGSTAMNAPSAGLAVRDLTLTVAGHDVTLHRTAKVYLGKTLPQDYIMCDLGQDVLKNFKSYTLNLQSMSLTLTPN